MLLPSSWSCPCLVGSDSLNFSTCILLPFSRRLVTMLSVLMSGSLCHDGCRSSHSWICIMSHVLVLTYIYPFLLVVSHVCFYYRFELHFTYSCYRIHICYHSKERSTWLNSWLVSSNVGIYYWNFSTCYFRPLWLVAMLVVSTWKSMMWWMATFVGLILKGCIVRSGTHTFFRLLLSVSLVCLDYRLELSSFHVQRSN